MISHKIITGLSLFLIYTFLCGAQSQGIHVVSKEGEQLYLYQDYYALVIGVSDYERWPDLPNAIKDANEVADCFKKMGFKVELVTDPTSTQLKAALNKMAYETGKQKDRALILYYAGHGETETLADKTKLGYIIPRDCPLLKDDPMGFAERVVSMKDIEALSLRIRSRHVLMIFDSCFSGSIFSLVRAVPEDITEKIALPVRQYITAGREDEMVPDKSMFKRCLLLGLEGDADLTKDAYVTGSELGMYLSDKVVNYTHKSQHPQYGKINNPDLDRGDFVFARAKFVPLAGLTQNLESERKRLEDEYKKLELERKRVEEQKQKLAMFKPPTKPYSKDVVEIGRDGCFIAYSNGIVKDTETGLEWVAGRDIPTSWEQAKSWVIDLSVDGGGWRMPTREELKTLYRKGAETDTITSLLKTSGTWIWSGETRNSSSAWGFSFFDGSEGWHTRSTTAYGIRGLAVRSRR